MKEYRKWFASYMMTFCQTICKIYFDGFQSPCFHPEKYIPVICVSLYDWMVGLVNSTTCLSHQFLLALIWWGKQSLQFFLSKYQRMFHFYLDTSVVFCFLKTVVNSDSLLFVHIIHSHFYNKSNFFITRNKENMNFECALHLPNIQVPFKNAYFGVNILLISDS